MIKAAIALRRIISALILIIMFFGAYGMTESIYTHLNIVQIGPLFLRTLAEMGLISLSLFLVIITATLIFGRWYCSTLCPLGTTQDLIMGARSIFKPYKFKYRKLSRLRFTLFIIIAALLFSGIIFPFSTLDPFSIFTRFTATTVFPAADAVKNHVLDIDIYRALAAAGAIIFIAALVIWKGRFFCNTLCPVGAMLGEVGKCSKLGIKIKGNCVKCGACEKICKAEAINAKAGLVDHSKCVMCLNCLGACRFNAITYGKSETINQNKRKFIWGALAFSAAAVASNRFVFQKRKFTRETLAAPMPPGIRSYERLQSKCMSCNACAQTCPVGIIRMRKNLPSLDFDKGFCQFECNDCTKVCPTNAIMPIDNELKKKTKIGEAGLNLDICVVRAKDEACGACAEHCPTGALTMIPNEKGIPEPVLNKELCIGCGACTYICPVRPTRAINVSGLAYPTIARQLKKREDNIIEDDNESFAF